MNREVTMHTFSTPQPIRLRVELWEGTITVLAEQTDTTTVELVPEPGSDTSQAQQLIDKITVEQRGDEIVVLAPRVKGGLFRRGSHVHATIRVPLQSSAKVESGSADIETRGALGDVQASSGSGDVHLASTADVQVRTGSGDITIDVVAGSCSTKSGSADVFIGSVTGDANVVTGSGDVMIDAVNGTLNVKSGSGDVLVKSSGDSVDALAGSGDLMLRRVDHGRVKAKTGSGDIAIGVANGTAAYLDVMTMSGDVRSDLNGSDGPGDAQQHVEIQVLSGSGDVLLQRA
jgi:DUF4097 and DUF4098 domain-containing protein YvlB